MMPRGKRGPVPLSHPELSGTDGEGPRSGGEGQRSTPEEEEEEEEEEEGHLSGLPRDDLAKSMSGSSVSSYHSALCSEETETFKDCLEFLDEEGTAPQDVRQRGGRVEGAAPGRWAAVGAPGVPPPPGPLARPRQAQLSLAAKNSPGPGQGGRMGPLGGDCQPATAATTASGEPALPRQPGGMLGGLPSDSDEADGEVRALTARAFRSLSGLPGAHLDMCSSQTSSSLSNSLSEDGGRPRQWSAASGESRGTVATLHGRVGWPFPTSVDGELLGLLGKEQFECVDVELESGEARKGHSKKRTVPKRQILLKRKERKETGFGPWGDGPAPQPLPPARKEPPSKGRAIGEDFRFNYKQFMKVASLDTIDKTRAASCLVKNVLAKKMQYEQRIKMEQKGLRGSSTSSGPSSAGTDLLGDGLEGKSSSLSRSDCSFSAEDLRGGGMPAAAGAVGDATTTTTHPAKGVVLSESTRENVCKLKKTFNELNQRMKYREVLEGHRLPSATEDPASERICYQQARALFEAHPQAGKALDVAPKFQRGPRPWPSLKQRAIRPSRPQTLPFKSAPAVPPRPLLTSRTQEVKLVPQSQREEKPPAVPHQPPSPGTPTQGSLPASPPEADDKGKGRIPQPRDVRKLLKSSYSLSFGTAAASQGTKAPASGGDRPPATPLVIHCTSVCRRDTGTGTGNREAPAAASPEAAPAQTEGPAKLPGRRPSPPPRYPIHITRVQATQRAAAATEGPAASPPRQERSELRVPARVARAEGVPHMETHLHVLLGRRSPAVAEECSPAPSRATLRTEKTVLLPPAPGPTEGKDGGDRGSPGGLRAAGGQEAAGPRHGGTGSRDPQDRTAADSNVHPQPGKPAGRRAPEPPRSEQVPAGSSTGPTAPFGAGEAAEGPAGHREAWEHLPTWPAATEPCLPAAPADNSNYLAIPVKTPKTSPMPKLPLVPNPSSASLGTPLIPNLASTSLGTPMVPNMVSASFGTPMVPNPASTSFGTPSVPNPASTSFASPLVSNPASTSFGIPTVPNMTNSSFGYSLAPSLTNTSFGAPLVSNTNNKSFGTPLIPYPSSTSFGTTLVPSPYSTSFGSPLAPNPSSASFGSPLAPNPSSASFGTPLAPNPSSASFGSPLAPNPSSASFGTPLAPNPSSASFGNPLAPNPSSASFGTPMAPNPSSASFGNPLAPNPSSASFGSPLAPNPSSASFGNPLAPNPSSASFGNPLAPNPSSASFGTPLAPNPSSASFGTPLAPNPSSASFGNPLAPNPSSASFGSPLAPNPSSASFGNPLAPNPSSASFGSPLAPYPSSASFGTPLVPIASSASFETPFIPHPVSASFGTPLAPNQPSVSFGTPSIPYPASASFGTPLAPNLSSTSFGTPLVPYPSSSSLGIPMPPNPTITSFGTPLVTNPVPASLGHPSASNVSSSSFGSPLAPNLASPPLGTGVCPPASREPPWSKPSPDSPLSRPAEGLVPLPPAQPQPRLEDAPHFLRRTDGASPGSKSTLSPTKPFASHPPTPRRMLVDPDSGKCYYMEPPRQPQLKTLYDPETGQYLEVLIPPAASHAGLCQAPFNPLVMAPGIYTPPYVPYSGFPGLPAPPPPADPSPVHPDLPAPENPGFSRTFSPATTGEGPPAAGGPDCGYLEGLYYIPTGMQASPGPSPSQPPAQGPEKGPQLPM